jgi:hypothetical protein
MAVTTTNLGVITAYGDAVAAGYTGTKAEWQALMASYATVGQQAVDAKNAAVAAKDTAVAKATEATTAASTATTKASEASASAESIAESAAQIQENTDDIDQLKSDLSYITSTKTYSLLTGGYYKLNDATVSLTPVSNQYYNYLAVDCVEGDVFTISGKNYGNAARLYAFIDSSNNVLEVAYNYIDVTSKVITAPTGAVKLLVNEYVEYPVKLIKGTLCVTDKMLAAKFGSVGYVNYTFTDGKAIITPASGTANLTPADVGSVSCVVVECEKGDVFTINGMPRNNSGTRPYMFVDVNNVVLYRSELTTLLTDYSVIAPANGKLVVNLLSSTPYTLSKGYSDVSKQVGKYNQFSAEPLTYLPDYFVNNLANKPIGNLDKGYVCLSCDDGAVQLATYTIPMLIAKNVPCTFSLWSTSAVFTDYTNTIVDAIQNHNCELGQHGNQIWAEEDGSIAFTESMLTDFFDSEKAFWDSLGLTPKCAVCPAHYNNALVRAVAGGRFGAVRSGVEYVTNHYDYYSSGARSNLYGMSAQNINGRSLDGWKAAIDYAYDNHKILNIYWHDYDLTDAQKGVLEAVIDYAKTKGIEFCTIGQIPNIL